MATAKKTSKPKSKTSRGVSLLVGTRKGAWFFHSDAGRKAWRVDGPTMLGQIVNHLVRDTRSGTMLMAAKTGHLGPTIFRSTDKGKTWKEAAVPPAFRKVDGGNGRAVDHTFWLSQGHDDEKGVWWAGASPPGLFVSSDDGVSWASVDGFNEHAMYDKWAPKDGSRRTGRCSIRF